MKKRNLLLLILGIGVIIKFGLYQFCKMIDKPFTNHSSTLNESRSNNFLLENYKLSEINQSENLEFKNDFNLNSIFIENNWDYKCSIWRIDKVPTKVNGQNIVLPMKVVDLENLDKFMFYLANGNDTLTLRGNRTIETAYYNKTFNTHKELSKSELLIKDKKGILATRRFTIEK